MSKEQDNILKSIQQELGTTKSGVAPRILGMALKLVEKGGAIKVRVAFHPSASPCSTHSYIRAKRPLQITLSSIMDVMDDC